MVTWVKTNTLLGVAVVAWLVALAPAGKIGKGVAHIVAIATSIESVRYSRKLVLQEARHAAIAVMNQELEQVDLALQEHSQERALEEMYGVTPTYTQSVREEIEKSLEHLVQEPSVSHPVETSTSTSRKNLYIAIVTLLEVGKSETFIVEKILKQGGRDFEKGMKLLHELLQEGKQNEW